MERRKGSGIYVRSRIAAPPDELTMLLKRAVRLSRERGASDQSLLHGLRQAQQRTANLVLVEPDFDLARIVLHECTAAGVSLSAVCDLPLDAYRSHLAAALGQRTAVVLPSKAQAVRDTLAGHVPIVLTINPVAHTFAQHLPLSRDYLVIVASHWPSFLHIARGMLLAAGFSPDALVCRDTRQPGWRQGLAAAAGVVCDSYTATLLPPSPSTHVFHLLAPQAVAAF